MWKFGLYPNRYAIAAIAAAGLVLTLKPLRVHRVGLKIVARRQTQSYHRELIRRQEWGGKLLYQLQLLHCFPLRARWWVYSKVSLLAVL